MGMYNGRSSLSREGFKLLRSPVKGDFAHDPRFTNTKTVQETEAEIEREGKMPVSCRTGGVDQIREAAEQAMNGMKRLEGRLRQEGVYLSDGRIISLEEARERGVRIRQGEEPLPQGDPRAFSRVNPSYSGPDPRAAPGAHMREQYAQGMADSLPGGSQRYTQGSSRQASLLREDVQNPVYGDGNEPMLGDIVQHSGAQMLGEVVGEVPGAILIEIPQMGNMEVPVPSLREYRLMGRSRK